MDLLKRLLSWDEFMPHGCCYMWNKPLLWLHICSDALIFLSYFTIPFTLIWFVRKRKDLPFSWMFVCFALFIISCGTTHLMEIVVINRPYYWLSGVIKAITALSSVPTAILLVCLVPKALAIPSPRDLQTANKALEESREELEERVRQRTAELERLNAELAVARDAAVQASLAKSRFLANMSHELRTPLNAITGYADLLREQMSEDVVAADVQRDLGRIRAASDHLLAIISNILDLSKIEAGRMGLHIDDFAVEPLVRELAGVLQPIALKGGNRLHLEISGDLGRMRSDPVKLRQILYNLLSNACKFTSKGDIWFRVRRLGGVEPNAPSGRLFFEVEDTGIGIDRQQVGHLFEKFHQGDQTSTRVHGGTGLGLAISQALCSMMGGAITFDPEYTKGARFRVQLPATAPSATSEDIASTLP